MNFILIPLVFLGLLVVGCSAQDSGRVDRTLSSLESLANHKVQLDWANVEAADSVKSQDPITQLFTSSWPQSQKTGSDLSFTPLAVAVSNSCLREQAAGALTALVDFREMIPGLETQVYSIQLPTGTSLIELNAMAEQDPCVRRVSFDGSAKLLASTSEPRAPQQLHLETIRYFQALPHFQDDSTASSKSTDVLVGVIDTGIDNEHEDLRTQVARLPSGHFGYNLYHNNYDTSDISEHGTHVAGLIAANPNNGIGGTGVAGPGVRVFAARVFDNLARTTVSIVANAIRYSVEQGADVINISLSGPGTNAILEDALREATRKGVVIVVAAGNDRINLAPTGRSARWPASYGSRIPGVITVGSVHSVKKSFSSFSNYGEDTVEIAAPGEFSILSTVPKNKYKAFQGTSMASPIVAGAVARMIRTWKLKKTSYTPALVEDVLKESSPVVPALLSRVEGGRILDLAALAEHLEENKGESEFPDQPRPPASQPPANYWGTLQDVQDQGSSYLISGYLCASSVNAPERIRVLFENDSKGQYQPAAQNLFVDTWPAWSEECPGSMFIQHHFYIEIDKSYLSGYLPATISVRVTTEGVNWFLPGAGLYEIHP